MYSKSVRLIAVILIIGVMLVGVALVQAQTSAVYDLTWHVLGAGGGQATSASYSLEATLGQPIVGVSSSALYAASAGFWVKFEAIVREYLPFIGR